MGVRRSPIEPLPRLSDSARAALVPRKGMNR